MKRSTLHEMRQISLEDVARAMSSIKSRVYFPTPVATHDPTTIEALRLMRDTTQSRDQFDRAVAALEAMGVRDE